MMIPGALGLWGFIFELASVAFDPKISLAIESLQSNNSILDLLQVCASNSTDLIEPLVQYLNTSVLQNEHLTNDAKMKAVFEEISQFSEQNPSLKIECQNEKMENGLDLRGFMEVAVMFKRSAEVENLFRGDQPKLISDLIMYLLNSSHSSESVGNFNTESVLLEEFVDQLCTFFENQTSIHRRLQYAAEVVKEMKEGDRALVKGIPIGKWGTIDDLIKVNAFFTYHGFHELNSSAECEEALELVKINITTNSTQLLDSLNVAVNEWTWSERQNFQMFFDKLRQHTLSKLHSAEKLLRVAKTVRFYENQESKMEKKLLETKLANWGTFEELCACVGF